VKPLRYSSLSAFLEHRRALKRATTASLDQRATLAEMERILSALDPGIRDCLDDESSPGAPLARRRERARRALARELSARGILSG
jgi:hypothetical protein